jgi:hypothetical protein
MTKHLPQLAILLALPLVLLQPNSLQAQAAPVPVAYDVVCDDANMKLVFEQKVVAAIKSTKGHVVDTAGKADTKLLFAVAPVKRKKDGSDETLGFAVATLAIRNGAVTNFENRFFTPGGYEQGIAQVIPQTLGKK